MRKKKDPRKTRAYMKLQSRNWFTAKRLKREREMRKSEKARFARDRAMDRVHLDKMLERYKPLEQLFERCAPVLVISEKLDPVRMSETYVLRSPNGEWVARMELSHIYSGNDWALDHAIRELKVKYWYELTKEILKISVVPIQDRIEEDIRERGMYPNGW